MTKITELTGILGSVFGALAYTNVPVGSSMDVLYGALTIVCMIMTIVSFAMRIFKQYQEYRDGKLSAKDLIDDVEKDFRETKYTVEQLALEFKEHINKGEHRDDVE